MCALVTGVQTCALPICAAGAGAFVQVSAIGADPHSRSRYGRTKGEGEARVLAAFPGATIIRPSVIFGPEDDFINRFARMAKMLPVIPVVKTDARLQPVWVGDVADAVARAAGVHGEYGGKTFELGGPRVNNFMGWVGWRPGTIT